MRASLLTMAMLCTFLTPLVCGCPKQSKTDDVELVSKEALAARRSGKEKAGEGAAKVTAKAAEVEPTATEAAEKTQEAQAEKAGEAATSEEPAGTKASTEGTPEAAPAEQPAPEAEEPASAKHLEEAWGNHGKDRYSQATAGPKREQSELAIASGTDYSRKEDTEIDKLRAEELRGPLPRADLFRVLGYIRTPFRMIGTAPTVAAGTPGPEAAGAETTVTQPGPEQPTQVASGPLTVPPVSTGMPAAAQPGEIQGPIIISERPQTAPRLSPEQRRQLEAKQFLSERFGAPQSGAARPAPVPSMNLSVAGTVVGNDGRATAILSDGTNSVSVKEGDHFTFNGRSYRVVRVAQGRVDVSDGKQKTSLGVGGTGP